MAKVPPVVLFDGVCNLCNGAVDFIVRHDPAGRFRFAALQSEAAAALLAPFGRAAGGEPGTVTLIEDGRLWERSDAVLRIAHGLGGPWRLAGALRVFPRPLRDLVYDLVARNRFRWFGRRDTCRVPSDEERARFL